MGGDFALRYSAGRDPVIKLCGTKLRPDTMPVIVSPAGATRQVSGGPFF